MAELVVVCGGMAVLHASLAKTYVGHPYDPLVLLPPTKFLSADEQNGNGGVSTTWYRPMVIEFLNYLGVAHLLHKGG